MKKFIIKLFVFIFLFLLSFILLNSLCQLFTPENDRYALQYKELYNPTVDADIVVFGTSKSARGINPKILETDSISVFNFGLNGSNPEFIYKWYKNIFKINYPKPKLILLEINWLMFDKDFMWRSFEQDSRYFTCKDYLLLLKNTEKKYTAFFNRYHVFNRSVGSGGEIDLTYNGYTPFDQKYSNSKSTKTYINSIDFDSDNQLKYFKMLLNLFKKEDVNVILLILPEVHNKSISSNDLFKDCTSDIKKISSEIGFKLLDYTYYFESESLFKDWQHLNITGAELITNKIKSDIKKEFYND